MKKAVSLLLVPALLLTLLLSAIFVPALADFNMNAYYKYADLFFVDMDEDADTAFIYTKFSAEDQSFTHKYDSAYYYSYIYTDVLVTDQSTADRFPVLRTWIVFHADRRQHFTSVDFILDGKTYTFTDIGGEDHVLQKENGWRESLLIRYGSANSDFLRAVSGPAVRYAYNRYAPGGDRSVTPPKMRMILHGNEDLEIDVPDMFWLDFAVMYETLYGTGSASCIGENIGTPCSVR